MTRLHDACMLGVTDGNASPACHFSDKALFQPALLYWSSWRGSRVGFAQLNQEMKRYVDVAGRRWLECVRVKRGLSDCSAPGAFCKEQCTWDGIVRLLYHRRSPLLNWRTLHCAKMTLEQYQDIAPHLDTEHSSLIMPHFLTPIALYCQRIDTIAEHNGLADWLAHETPQTPACRHTPLSYRPPAVPVYIPTPLPQGCGVAAQHTRDDSNALGLDQEEEDEDVEEEEGEGGGG